MKPITKLCEVELALQAAVIRMDNGMGEPLPAPGHPIEIGAFLSGGRSLWRRPLIGWEPTYGNANNAPLLINDMDGDGKGEVIGHLLAKRQDFQSSVRASAEEDADGGKEWDCE